MYRRISSIILKLKHYPVRKPIKITGLASNWIVIDEYITQNNDSVQQTIH